VPNSYSASDEGKVVNNGALVAQSTRSITENGTYDTTLKNQVTVNVSGGGGGDVEPVLPSEYQEVEYIDFDGNSWVTLTEEELSGSFIVECFATYTDGNTSELVAVGVSNTSSERFELYFSGGQARIYNAGGNLKRMLSAIKSIALGPSGSPNVNVVVGEKVYQMIALYNFTASGVYMTIGTYDSSYRYRSRLYKVKKTNLDMVIGDATKNTFGTYLKETKTTWFKPCYRKSDNVPGWYDTTNDVFYPNEGTGVFIVGPDIN
jgi:hypothetical protein